MGTAGSPAPGPQSHMSRGRGRGPGGVRFLDVPKATSATVIGIVTSVSLGALRRVVTLSALVLFFSRGTWGGPEEPRLYP